MQKFKGEIQANNGMEYIKSPVSEEHLSLNMCSIFDYHDFVMHNKVLLINTSYCISSQLS